MRISSRVDLSGVLKVPKTNSSLKQHCEISWKDGPSRLPSNALEASQFLCSSGSIALSCCIVAIASEREVKISVYRLR